MRRAGRRDGNHAEVRDKLREAGYSVLDLGGVGRGCPDLLVALGDHMWLLEVKDGSLPPSARALTADEEKFHNEWKGSELHVVHSVDEALFICRPYGP